MPEILAYRGKLKLDIHSNFSEIDLKIIRLLQKDPRSFTKISRSLGLSVGTIYNHVKKLEQKGILKGYTVTVDSDKLGYDLTAFILIEVDSHYHTDVKKELVRLGDILAFYEITGKYDLLVIARFKDKIMLNGFIKNIQKQSNVRKTHVNVALDIIKEDFRVKL